MARSVGSPKQLQELRKLWKDRFGEKTQLQHLFAGYDGTLMIGGKRVNLSRHLSKHPTQKSIVLGVAKQVGSIADKLPYLSSMFKENPNKLPFKNPDKWKWGDLDKGEIATLYGPHAKSRKGQAKIFTTGKVAVLAGVTSGLGFEYAKCLVAHGLRKVFLLCKSPTRGFKLTKLLNQLSPSLKVEVIKCDFAKPREVVAAADIILASKDPVNLLVCNVAMLSARRRVLKVKMEEMFCVNYFSSFVLCRLLLPRMKQLDSAPSRIVVTGCDSPEVLRWKLDFTHMHGDVGALILQYTRTKLMSMMLVSELNRLLGDEILPSGEQAVTVNIFHPGACNTKLVTDVLNQYSAPAVANLGKSVYGWSEGVLVRSPLQGATLGVFLCCSSKVEGVSGMYFESGNFGKVNDFTPKPLKGSAANVGECKRLTMYAEKVYNKLTGKTLS